MKEQTIAYLLREELKDIFHAEQQLVKALPKAIQAAATSDLKKGLELHLEETKEQVERLKECFAILNTSARGKACAAMEGLVHECQELISDYDRSYVRDAGLISKCQRIEHYEIATYSSLFLFAQELELDRVADLLEATLNEEIQANKNLATLLEGGILYSGISQKALAEC
ncbi:MAG: ferritin-like domain-containing protein [Parachlamydia sp.]|nr:ferritin-like domain-containing protein [Parachlamydia sp.]